MMFYLTWWRVINKLHTYVLFLIKECYCANASFDLWMYKGAHDMFTLVIIFLGFDLRPKHVTLNLFETTNATRHALTRNLIDLLNVYGLKNKIIMHVKNKGSNLNTLISALIFFVICEALDWKENFQGTYFRHVFSKAFQYANVSAR
jgi:hypothetical protein